MIGYELDNYWSQPAERLLAALESSEQGLGSEEAARRLEQVGPNTLKLQREVTAWRVLLGQFTNPLVLILIVAALISTVMQEWVDATVVIVVVISSALLSFGQEYAASNAVAKLRARVTIKANVLRDSKIQAIPSEQIVPGDIVLLSAGSLIPADGALLEAKDFFVNQAVLTGETFPVEKMPGVAAELASLAQRNNVVFMGTSVRTGSAKVLIVQTGLESAYGQIADRLTLRPPETDFERGIRHFGYLLTQVMLVLVLVVFAANVFAAKPAIDSLLFAMALAVGLAPELLPAIVSVTLAKGAQLMATQGVIVRRLNAIENLGSMDVLCTDKTGTLTQGVVHLDGALDVRGNPSTQLLQWAALNAHFQTGLANPMDEAILQASHQATFELGGFDKVDEIPYDFVRKRMSVVVTGVNATPTLISKGALDRVLEVCNLVQLNEQTVPLSDTERKAIQRRADTWSKQGFRVLGLATRTLPGSAQSHYQQGDEQALTFCGYLIFFDPPKEDANVTIAELTRLGVQLKIITGDSRAVAQHVASLVGLDGGGVLSGAELNQLHDEALWNVADKTSLFVEVDPNQKERIISALQKMGHVVGYMGDGINDAPALHAADVGISVDSAVDVAKEAADFVLLEANLDVLVKGIVEGRKTFANTIKYIFTTTSANFGNMLSMAGASIFLPFLPLLAKQILLNNFLSDIPGMTIANDAVDAEWIERPQRWNMSFIRNFMIVFGLVSSLFDYLTFGVLLLWLRAGPDEFRTGWFIESLLTELVIALVVRTRRPFFRSQPGRWLLLSTLTVALIALVIPYLPFTNLFGFVPLPPQLMLTLLILTALYVLCTEVTKHFFYR
ncbi:MAG: magnesium-translocating P-type ATPase [Caldilineaceae bacterium]